jgi:serine/threonine-protein kinase
VKYCDTCRSAYPNDFNTCPRDQAALRATADLVPGMVLRGKYEVIEKVGAGGMAAVYKARHLAFGEIRAVKVVAARLSDDEGFLKRFRTEAIVTRRLQHPHAVRVDDLDVTEDGRPFIVMEYVEGRNLREVIRAEGALPVARAAAIGRQVASALAAAHGLGITHRDIKPDNILLTAAPDGGDHAKVLDFGIAKVREGALEVGPGYTPTETGMVVGTPQYMSPEQAMGKRGDQLDNRSDLYSLGVALYEMITGRLPFQSTTPMELILAHAQTPPPPPQAVRPDLALPSAVNALVMRALQKDRDRRFRTAEEMESALAALASLPDTAVSQRPTVTSVSAASRAKRETGARPGTEPTPLATPAARARGPAGGPRPSAPPAPPAGETLSASSTPALVASGLVILVVLGAIGVRSVARSRRAAVTTAPAPVIESPAAGAPLAVPAERAAPGADDSDARIQNDIQRLLVSSSALRSQPIAVEVGNGIVTLSGTAADATSAQLAESFASSVPGVRRVFNTLRVAAGPPATSAVSSAPNATPAAEPAAGGEDTPPTGSRRGDADAPQETVVSLIEKAKREMAAGNMAGALAACQSALRIQPANPMARECIRRLQMAGGGPRRR